MKLRFGFILREVLGAPVVVATGDAARHFHGMVKLNETGGIIWKGLQEGLTEPQLAERLALTYDVTPEQASADVAAMLRQMADNGFLEP